MSSEQQQRGVKKMDKKNLIPSNKNIKIIKCYSFCLVTILQWHYAF